MGNPSELRYSNFRIKVCETVLLVLASVGFVANIIVNVFAAGSVGDIAKFGFNIDRSVQDSSHSCQLDILDMGSDIRLASVVVAVCVVLCFPPSRAKNSFLGGLSCLCF